MMRKPLAQYAKDKATADTLADRLTRERETAIRNAQIAELKRLTSAENHRQDALRSIRGIAVMIEPPKYKPIGRPSARAPQHTLSLVTSDWQTGQYSKLGASGGMYTQTTAITKRQVDQMWQRFTLRQRIEADAKKFKKFNGFSLGDLLEGDQMRVSQASEIDNLVTRQFIDVYDMQSGLIARSLEQFEEAEWDIVGGNHDRTSSKPGNAGLGELGFTDTWTWVMGELLKRQHERSIDSGRLKINNHESFFGTNVVAGLRCVFEHGASFKTSTGSYGGVPFYPIANAARSYQAMLDGADLIMMGHHHKAMVLPMNGGWGWQVMNGALPPSSSWVQASFKGYGRPTQIMLDLHEDIGLAGWAPLYLEQPEHGRPGSFWKKRKGAA